jgi:RimJ/RimL family protein N-acetyltransferase
VPAYRPASTYEERPRSHSVAALRRPRTAFAIAVGDEAIGVIGLHPGRDVHRRSAEIGFWLGEPFWGRGIATRAVRALTARAFERTKLVRIHAHVFEWNEASARVLEKAGYALEGRLRKSVFKDGRIIDQLLFATLAPDVDEPPLDSP